MTDSKQSIFDEFLAWQSRRNENLRNPTGWLTLCGLAWLKIGDNTFGSDSSSSLVLPSTVPLNAGSVHLDELGKVTLQPVQGVELLVDGQAVAGPTELRSDATGPASVVSLGNGDVTFLVIVRDGKIGVRAKNRQSPVLVEFKGVPRFEFSSSWVVPAVYKSHEATKTLILDTVVGLKEAQTSPGFVQFELSGQSYTLDVITEDGEDDTYWIMFKDATNGHETYDMRYLYTKREDSTGALLIDFNRAYNPPSSFTKFGACPIPPLQNCLPVRVEAGEKRPS